MSETSAETGWIEIIRPPESQQFRYALFDFDGTISLLRKGWERIMAPLMVEMTCGGQPPTPEIEAEVLRYIEESRGIQTIVQMEHLAAMVRKHGMVEESEIRDAQGYKALYNERLMVPVKRRLDRLESGAVSVGSVTVPGSVTFVEELDKRNLALYIFSGTDRPDVRNEAARLGVARYFEEIWGALATFEEYSKEKTLKELIATHGLGGAEVLVIGDGPIEIRCAKEAGGYALGVASDEAAPGVWNRKKREALLAAGADALVADFSSTSKLLDFLFTD